MMAKLILIVAKLYQNVKNATKEIFVYHVFKAIHLILKLNHAKKKCLFAINMIQIMSNVKNAKKDIIY